MDEQAFLSGLVNRNVNNFHLASGSRSGGPLGHCSYPLDLRFPVCLVRSRCSSNDEARREQPLMPKKPLELQELQTQATGEPAPTFAPVTKRETQVFALLWIQRPVVFLESSFSQYCPFVGAPTPVVPTRSLLGSLLPPFLQF